MPLPRSVISSAVLSAFELRGVISPDALERGTTHDRPAGDAVAIDRQVDVADAPADPDMCRAEGMKPVDSCIGHDAFLRCTLFVLPGAPDGQSEAIIAILRCIADRLQPTFFG